MADHGDDLDQLLDSALDDFQSLNLTSSSSQRNGPNEGNKQEKSDMPIEIQGLGMGLPDLRSKKKGKRKVEKDSHASEALGKLREHTREAVKSLESVTEPELLGGENLENETIEGWVKQFEELASSKEMETIMETVMKQLLSKEVLQEPIKEICERYPKWLEDNKSKTSKEEYERFLTQYQLMKELSEVFETDSGNSNKIFDLMQKMQECGQPPNDIMQQLGGSDFSNLAHLSPEMLEQCSIM